MATNINSNIDTEKTFGCKGGECIMKFKCDRYVKEGKYKVDPMFVYDNRVGKFICPMFLELRDEDVENNEN